MFLGFIDEGAAATLLFQLRGNSNEPVEPDSAPTWRIFGANGQVASGTGSASSFESGSVTGATNASPIVITSAAHPVVTGQSVTVASVGGNTAANGTFIATYVGTNTFSLGGTTGNGSYTSGGTWKTTGLYKVALSGAVLNSFEAGRTYTVVLTFTLSGNIRTIEGTFTVR
jgi:hypothetical protein